MDLEAIDPDAIRNAIEAFAPRYDLELLLQFGSTVTGREHPRSDLDIAALSRRDLGFSEHGSLAADLADLFPSRRVDLALIRHADPLFLKKVTEACVLLWGEPRRLAELKMQALARFQDYRGFLLMERRYVEGRLGGTESA